MQEELIKVSGGARLSGVVPITGAKNSVLKLMAASILASGATTITNTPAISDVFIMGEVLKRLGAQVHLDGHVMTIDTTGITSYETPYDLVVQMRASVAVLGPLVGRFGRARVAMPGGCQIGSRKLDMHLLGLEELGVSFEVSHGYINATVPKTGLKAAHVTLEFASVGATENLMVAACCAKGTTVIENAAREPEISDLANFLNLMGARISGQGTPVITVEGVDPSSFVPVPSYSTVGDRIEAGTFLVAGALAGGPLTVQGVNPEFLALPLKKLKSFGAHIETGEDFITISREKPLKATDIQTLPYPGFPTDLQPQFMVLTAVAQGTSVITENIFENRFMFADELIRMGANIRIEGHHAIVEGVEQLSGAPVRASDLRAGAGLVLAGLVADGETTVGELTHIDRGYEGFVDKLKAVGAQIERA